MIIDQLLERICNLHKSGYLHRNIKPENLMIGVNDNKTLKPESNNTESKNYFLIFFKLIINYYNLNVNY